MKESDLFPVATSLNTVTGAPVDIIGGVLLVFTGTNPYTGITQTTRQCPTLSYHEKPVLTWVSFLTTSPPSAAVTTRSMRILAFLLQLLQTHFSQHQNALTQVYRTRRRSHVHVLYVSFPHLHHLPFLVILRKIKMFVYLIKF